jgi:hypothetical protein
MTSDIVSDGGGFQVFFMFDNVGYVKDPERSTADARAIMTRFVERYRKRASDSAAGGPREYTWKVEPRYDAKQHSWEWAFDVRKPGEASSHCNYSLQSLGRRGVLTITVLSTTFLDHETFMQLVGNVLFRPGEGYSDFEQTDKAVNPGATELILATTEVENKAQDSTRKAGVTLLVWIGVSIIGAGAVLGLVLKVRKMRHAPRLPKPEPPQGQPEALPVVTAPTKPKAAPASTAAKQSLPRESAPRPTRAANDSATRRKKAFDYNRYFADLMSTVEGHGNPVEMAASSANGYPAEAAPAQSSATTNGHVPAPPANGQSDFIISQATLIEEQRKLIHEQTKLIEEKSKLIAEKNQILKLQAELMEGKLV